MGPAPAMPHVDVLIIGAGLSGIGMACHLTRDCPDRDFLVLERRAQIGGTWDLFRYPGIRSDSDVCTFGYSFQPWVGTTVLADGPSIRTYVQDTATEYGIHDRIQFGRKVISASWSSRQGRWTVEVALERTGERETYTADFLIGCTGYYDYDAGYRPDFPNEERFLGQIVHPQHWPEDLDYRGKRVVVIGSGATAVTLVPAMSPAAARVTMLQRSPSYVISLPVEDPIAAALKRARVPAAVVYRIGRARNIAIQRAMFQLSRVSPRFARKVLDACARAQLGPEFDLRHFTPDYAPWDQRLCVVPSGDLFKVLRNGSAEIVTDQIETFTERGIRLTSGRELEADLIVTATGLTMQMLGGAAMDVDGEPVLLRDTVTYKGVMIGGVPNAGIVLGYTNAAWTLRADLSAEWLCRLLNHMRDKGFAEAVAVPEVADFTDESILGAALDSGYIRRGDAVMPRQGARGPWKLISNFYRDWAMVRAGRLDDGILRLTATRMRPPIAETAAESHSA